MPEAFTVAQQTTAWGNANATVRNWSNMV